MMEILSRDYRRFVNVVDLPFDRLVFDLAVDFAGDFDLAPELLRPWPLFLPPPSCLFTVA